MNMRQSARDSILTLPRNGNVSNRSTVYSFTEDSQTPILAHGPVKSSGLRQQYYDDNSVNDYDEGIMMPPEQRHDGRF
jgi:hypothetical protein